MNYLQLIHANCTGSVYDLKSVGSSLNEANKVQLQIGEIAIVMHINELKNFLGVIRSVNEKCVCNECEANGSYRTIKCRTEYVEVKIKSTPKVVKDLEELILAVIYNKQVENILLDNNIN